LRNRKRKLHKALSQKMSDEFRKAMEQATLKAQLAKGTGKPSPGGAITVGGEDFWGLIKRVHAD
jgi:hypothetical protein